MAGMKIIKIDVGKDGGINSKQLEELAFKHNNELACAMITYPSTSGVFDPMIRFEFLLQFHIVFIIFSFYLENNVLLFLNMEDKFILMELI
jgi:hypothetical protein